MKRKFLLVIAVMLIVVSAMAMLVGCSSSNPVDFIEKCKAAESKVIYSYSEGVVDYCAVYDNIIIERIECEEEDTFVCDYYEFFDDKVIHYQSEKSSENGVESWVAYERDIAEFAGDKETITANEYFNMAYVDWYEDDFENLDIKNDFEKKDGWFVSKKSVDEKIMAFKIKGKELLIQDDYKSKDVFNYKLVIGYQKIVLPEIAKQAVENMGEIITK